jgi:hypothetical protein
MVFAPSVSFRKRKPKMGVRTPLERRRRRRLRRTPLKMLVDPISVSRREHDRCAVALVDT